ncbi:MAG: hypothetical protein J0M08_12830 [Bacteroidetes bacterium]|nr:hypothetical protein [Bacteroidota bacterium]
MKKTHVLFLICILLVAINSPIIAQGCSQCKMIPQSNMNTGGSVASTLNPAILYLMAVPYLILFVVFRKQIISLYKTVRAKR